MRWNVRTAAREAAEQPVAKAMPGELRPMTSTEYQRYVQGEKWLALAAGLPKDGVTVLAHKGSKFNRGAFVATVDQADSMALMVVAARDLVASLRGKELDSSVLARLQDLEMRVARITADPEMWKSAAVWSVLWE